MRPFWLWHCSSYLKSESATKTWVKCAFQKGDERWYTGDESDVQGPVVLQVLPCRTHGSFWSYTFKFKRITLKYVFLLLIKYVYHHQIVMDWIGSRKHDMPLKMATFYGDFVFFWGGLVCEMKKMVWAAQRNVKLISSRSVDFLNYISPFLFLVKHKTRWNLYNMRIVQHSLNLRLFCLV